MKIKVEPECLKDQKIAFQMENIVNHWWQTEEGKQSFINLLNEEFTFYKDKEPELATKWKSIEEAPEDGTPILGYSTTNRIYIIKFDGKWHDMPELDFTHWMPLPKPPEKE